MNNIIKFFINIARFLFPSLVLYLSMLLLSLGVSWLNVYLSAIFFTLLFQPFIHEAGHYVFLRLLKVEFDDEVKPLKLSFVYLEENKSKIRIVSLAGYLLNLIAIIIGLVMNCTALSLSGISFLILLLLSNQDDLITFFKTFDRLKSPD